MHWDGIEWSIVPSPSPAGYGVLRGVTAIASDDVWAVGGFGLTLTMHWDGIEWSIVPSPSPGGNGTLYAVTAAASDDVWAVGEMGWGEIYTLILHWDGVQWSPVSSPNGSGAFFNVFYGVAALAADDIWAVGVTGDGGFEAQTMIAHWDGVQWSRVASPNPGAQINYLYGVSGVASDDVWAVGRYRSDNGDLTLVEHWDGTQWSVVPSPNSGLGFNELKGVHARSTDDAWAVGFSDSSSASVLIMHWDGIQWSLAPDLTDAGLAGVHAIAANDVWAVGGINSGPLVARYNDPCGTITPVPPTWTATQTGTATQTSTPTTTPTGTVVIVGHVSWQGRPAQPNARQQLPITLTIKIGNLELNYPAVTTDASGRFTVTTRLYPGMYNWRAKGSQYLANSDFFFVVDSQQPLYVEMYFMRVGDANDDNVVGSVDFNIVRASFGLGVGQPGYDDRADFNGDQIVNAQDFNLLRGNFGLGGAPPIRP